MSYISSGNIHQHQSERRGGTEYHHAGPSHEIQAPEGAPLPRQGPVQRVGAQPPGGASNRRSGGSTPAAVVSYISSGNIHHHQSERRGGENIIMREPHMLVRLLRALHSRGRVPSRALLSRLLEVQVIGGAPTTTAAVVSYISSGIIHHHQSERSGGENIIMRDPHMKIRLPRALHSRGRVPSKEFLSRPLEVQVEGGPEQQQQQQWCRISVVAYPSPSIREEGGGIS